MGGGNDVARGGRLGVRRKGRGRMVEEIGGRKEGKGEKRGRRSRGGVGVN